ncbi:MerC domain-containing protein [Emticicia sp. 17c]|uniref:MerC domain-containing protein n=1 Tax=Emticicia sp. 17c TaxID=3127704 RepID=UPI00301D3AB4
MRKIFTHYHNLNKVGLWLSILCTIHCLAMPFILTSLPYISRNAISERSEVILIGVSAGLAIYLLLKDYKNHRNPLPLMLLCLAVVFNVIGIFFVSGSYEVFFNVSGGLLMASAYGLNWYWHKRACHSHQH